MKLILTNKEIVKNKHMKTPFFLSDASPHTSPAPGPQAKGLRKKFK